jgi:hypothetical protein
MHSLSLMHMLGAAFNLEHSPRVDRFTSASRVALAASYAGIDQRAAELVFGVINGE